jgi:xanthine/uracil permease
MPHKFLGYINVEVLLSQLMLQIYIASTSLYSECCGQRFSRTMRAVQGAVIASSSLHIVLGFSGLWGILIRCVLPLEYLGQLHWTDILQASQFQHTLDVFAHLMPKWNSLCRFLSPIVIAPIIAIAGLGLYEYGFPAVSCPHSRVMRNIAERGMKP